MSWPPYMIEDAVVFRLNGPLYVIWIHFDHLKISLSFIWFKSRKIDQNWIVVDQCFSIQYRTTKKIIIIMYMII